MRRERMYLQGKGAQHLSNLNEHTWVSRKRTNRSVAQSRKSVVEEGGDLEEQGSG